MQTPFVVCVSAVVFSCLSLAMGQVAPGHPSFVPQDCGQYDCINLQNLNVSLNVPVYSKSGESRLQRNYEPLHLYRLYV